MNRAFADKAVRPNKVKFAFQAACPRAAVVAVKIIPHRAGDDVIFCEDVENVAEDVAHDANIINRLIDAAAKTIQVAKIVDAYANV